MSMTGYGKAEVQLEDKIVSIDLRSLNSKSLDLNIRTNIYFKHLEASFRKILSSKLQRGKVDLNISYEFNGEASPIEINSAILKKYINQLEKINQGGKDNLLSIAMRLPEVINSRKNPISEKEENEIVFQINNVVENLNKHRLAEGKVLEKDFNLRINIINKLLNTIKKIDPERISKTKQKIRESFKEIDLTIDANRFEQELIYYIEKYDITEEKVRLKNHLSYFIEVMEEEFHNGKKLGFISQEIGREINTIGSKANHAELQKIIVQMKDELEKIKEQLLNVL